jgi:hypothetical protein
VGHVMSRKVTDLVRKQVLNDQNQHGSTFLSLSWPLSRNKTRKALVYVNGAGCTYELPAPALSDLDGGSIEC